MKYLLIFVLFVNVSFSQVKSLDFYKNRKLITTLKFNSKKEKGFKRKSEKKYSRKKYKKASKLFKKAYKFSGDLIYLYNSASASLKAKKEEEALQCYATILSKEMDLLDIQTQKNIYKGLSIVFNRQHKKEEEFIVLKEAYDFGLYDLPILMNLANFYYDKGELKLYKNLLLKILDLPNKIDEDNIYYNLGVLAYQKGDFEQAKKHYKKAISLNPNNVSAYVNLSSILFEKDKEYVDEINKNLSNYKEYNRITGNRKKLMKKILPYLERANHLKKDIKIVKVLKSVYNVLEMSEKEKEMEVLYKSMK